MDIFIKPANISYPDIKAFFTTKAINGDLKKLSKAISLSESNIYLPIQKHTDKIIILDNDLSPKIADAVITKQKNILIGVNVADCVPILLYDKKRSVIGAVHAGWRGTATGILKKTISAICERFNSVPADITIAFGPSIRLCCYHVGSDVLESVIKETGEGNYYKQKTDAYCLDLATANKYQAMSVGILEKNIWISQECTYCKPDRFYSYRYAKGTTGRQGGFIGVFDS